MSAIVRLLLPMLLALPVSAQDAARDDALPRSDVVTANGIRQHYLDWGGKGEVVLLLAAFGSDAHVFDEFAPSLTTSFHVLGLTRRGFGESEVAPPGDTDTRVADILGFLDSQGLERVHLVGHSLAGDEITRFAGLHPECVGRIVYLDAAHDRRGLVEMLLADEQAPPILRRMALEAKGSPEAATIGVVLPPPDAWALHVSMLKATSEFVPDYGRIRAPVLALYALPDSHPALTPDTSPNVRLQLEADWVENGLPRLRKSIDQLREQLPGAEVVELKGAQHFLFLGATREEVARRTREFLEAPAGN